MKRTALILTVFTFFVGALSFACDEDTSSLNGNGEGTTPENTPLPNEKKSETTTPPATPAGSNTSKPPTPPPAGTKPPVTNTSGPDCGKTTTQNECAKCCGVSNNPFKDCACAAGSKCAQPCAANMCADKTPDFACGICLAQADCQTGDNPGGAAQTCMQNSQCSAKPE